jgi:hypothetical protein
VTNSPISLTRNQTAALALGTVVVALVVVWLVLSIGGNGTPPTSTTATSEPPPTDTTTTALETTTTAFATTTPAAETTTTTEPSPTTSGGVFDEVGAVEAFVEDFAEAIDAGDSSFLFERLHPAVKATYEDDICRAYIDDRVLPMDDYLQVGPVIGPFDSEFGEFPITSYEVRVSFEIDGDPTEEQAVFSLTEGVVRWFAECS